MPSNTPPMAPGRLPLLGHAVTLWRAPLTFLASQHHPAGLVEVRLGTHPAYLVTTGAVARAVFTDYDRYHRAGPMIDSLRTLIGEGLPTADNNTHHRQRPMIQTAFHRERLAQYVPQMVQCATDAVAAWRIGTPIDIYRTMHQLASTTLTRTLLSSPAVAPAAAQIEQHLPILLAGLYRRMILPVPRLHTLPTPANRRFAQALHAIRTATERAIRGYHDETKRPHDILTLLIEARDPHNGRPLTDHQIRDHIISIMVGGTESTASTLAWALHLLARNPALQKRVRHELHTTLQGQDPTLDTLRRLPFTHAVIKETLRMYPPGWITSRITATGVTLAGHHLPQGSQLLLSPYGLQHNPHVFPDPDRFDPDRWLNNDAPRDQRSHFAAFGGGPTKCIGDTFALTEIAAVLTTVLSRYHLEPTGPHRVRPHIKLFMSPHQFHLTPCTPPPATQRG